MGQGNGGGGCYDGCHDGPTALEYGKLTCFPTRTMEVLQHHDSPWQPADIALSPINLLFNFKLPNFINHYIARPLMCCGPSDVQYVWQMSLVNR